jgi:hypothetical protein
MNLELEYADLQLGETRNGVCPKCGQKKFYVTRKPRGIAFICFRVKCGYKGFAGCKAYHAEPLPAPPPSNRPGNPYKGELFLLDWTDIDYFMEQFGVELGESPKDSAYYCKVTGDNRYALPIWGPSDEYRGIVVRRPVWAGSPKAPRTDTVSDTCPKAVTYWEHNVRVRLSWHHSMNESEVIIVEDQVSAMRLASCGFTSVAILGTNFAPEFLRDFNHFKRGESRYVLALDPDASIKALKIARTWGPCFKHGLRVAFLSRDAKDYDDDAELLKDLGL